MNDEKSLSVATALKPYRTAGLMVLVAVVLFFVGAWVHSSFYIDRAPVQPIEFSHRIHAQEFQIPCMQCHTEAENSPVAGVPPVATCMGCHQSIATDAPEVQRLAAYWEAREPIPWVKVYDTPDHVHFTHKRHIRANVACQDCHGPVETMVRIERVQEPAMSWCVDCHRTKQVENGLQCMTCHI